MPRPYTNDETAPGIKFHATPRNAVIGTLRSDASMQDVGDRLTEAGIARAPLHFLEGAGPWRSSSVGELIRSRPTARRWRMPAEPSSPVPRWAFSRSPTRTRRRSGGHSPTPARNHSTTSVFLDLHLIRATLDFLASWSVPRSIPTSTARSARSSSQSIRTTCYREPLFDARLPDVRRNILGSLTRDGESCRRSDGGEVDWAAANSR
jgi:hypothetical protein